MGTMRTLDVGTISWFGEAVVWIELALLLFSLNENYIDFFLSIFFYLPLASPLLSFLLLRQGLNCVMRSDCPGTHCVYQMTSCL